MGTVSPVFNQEFFHLQHTLLLRYRTGTCAGTLFWQQPLPFLKRNFRHYPIVHPWLNTM